MKKNERGEGRGGWGYYSWGLIRARQTFPLACIKRQDTFVKLF